VCCIRFGILDANCRGPDGLGLVHIRYLAKMAREHAYTEIRYCTMRSRRVGAQSGFSTEVRLGGTLCQLSQLYRFAQNSSF
jgi:hypothetical protein